MGVDDESAGRLPVVAAGEQLRMTAQEARQRIAADLRRWGAPTLLQPSTDRLAEACAALALTGLHLGLPPDAVTFLHECRDWLDTAADLELAGADPDQPLKALHRVCGALRASTALLEGRR
ncbi:hypothetical protein OG618_37050 (plasmid) [Kitasatospora sp. NBC_01246]|uniref:hypothetical protein n=1 Tax=Kitasatospora sp. NBC_01246 TaxID=2903570 RepID=UPI002E35C68A|nr:hypothetical protein [Kitasatospora sp. NBC_01246]